MTHMIPFPMHYFSAEMSQNLRAEAAAFYSEHFGLWDADAASTMGAYHGFDRRIQIGPTKLFDMYMSTPGSVYVTITQGGKLTAIAFACRWSHGDRSVCWITSLVVHSDCRRRGLATTMVQHLREHFDDEIFGIVSHHPAACRAVSLTLECGNPLDLYGMEDVGLAIIRSAPIPFVNSLRLRGAIWNGSYDNSGRHEVIACANTGFHVDRTEALAALQSLKDRGEWQLGELPDGHEFVLIM